MTQDEKQQPECWTRKEYLLDEREMDLSEYGQGKWKMIDGKWQRELTYRDVKV